MLPPVLLINPNGPYIGLPSYAYPNIGEWESFSDSTPLTKFKSFLPYNIFPSASDAYDIFLKFLGA